jgi:hypothetical protein
MNVYRGDRVVGSAAIELLPDSRDVRLSISSILSHCVEGAGVFSWLMSDRDLADLLCTQGKDSE